MRLGSLSRKNTTSDSLMIIIVDDFSFFLLLILFIYRWKQNGKRLLLAAVFLRQIFGIFPRAALSDTKQHIPSHTVYFSDQQPITIMIHTIFRGIPSTLTFVQEPFEMGKDVGQGGQLFTILQQLRQVVGNRLWRLDLLMWIVIRLEDMICHHHHFEWDFFCLFLSLFFVFATRKSSLFICAQNFSPTTDCNREIR